MTNYSPSISTIEFLDGSSVAMRPGSLTFIVGPNNGGKSTFLRELLVDYHSNNVNRSKWVSRVVWNLGTREQFDEFIDIHFAEESGSFLRDRRTKATVLKAFTSEFYTTYRMGYPRYFSRILDAENRITLSNKTQSPDFINNESEHAYHSFFYNTTLEEDISRRVKDAFGYDFKINRTGANVIGYLGRAPTGDRLSLQYEKYVTTEMTPVDRFGDGVRSYIGILLNADADSRPVTIIDEPEAFLHPPQALRLGKELAELAGAKNRQSIIATHSSDLIKGALAVEGSDIQFLYMNHQNNRKYHVVPSEAVKAFGREPFLIHTDALDALFYRDVIICEAHADIMFFKWILSDRSIDFDENEIFWIPSYGKSAAPSIVDSMVALGIKPKCIFDIDVLLTPNVLQSICDTIGIDISSYKDLIQAIPSHVKTPPSANVLKSIEEKVLGLTEEDSDENRVKAIKEIKKSAEALSKSWSLKTTGLRLLPKGEVQKSLGELLNFLEKNGIMILREGEIENYAPDVGGHGRSWVRATIENDAIDEISRVSLVKQLKNLLIA